MGTSFPDRSDSQKGVLRAAGRRSPVLRDLFVRLSVKVRLSD